MVNLVFQTVASLALAPLIGAFPTNTNYHSPVHYTTRTNITARSGIPPFANITTRSDIPPFPNITARFNITARSKPTEVFSFSKWVDGIIANPNGDNLTPEEAVEAWHASINGTRRAKAIRSANATHIDKRVTCNTVAGTEAYVPDAVSCINQLASRGSEACTVDTVTVFCVIGQAQITGVRGGTNSATTSSCNDVARGAGAIMDSCTRADNMVQGAEFAHGNRNLLVHIRKPGL